MAVALEHVDKMCAEFGSNPQHRLAQNAVCSRPVTEVALNRSVVQKTDHVYSNKLDSDWAVTDQKSSGRCWLFAALNLLRTDIKAQLRVKAFELSQNYLFFWDKFERCNYFLEAVLQTADQDLTTREVSFLLDKPVNDGGQWGMLTAIINKYGVVPKTVMPEAETSGASRRVNQVVNRKLRECAQALRALHREGKDAAALQAKKQEQLEVLFRILCIHLGTPPRAFEWQWQDKDDAFHRAGVLTPLEFLQKYATINVNDYVCVVNDPRSSSRYHQRYTVKFLGNIIGAKPVEYLNLPMEEMKELTKRTMVELKQPVWFGCDCGKQGNNALGIWDNDLYDYPTLYDTEFPSDSNKADRLDYHETLMTHAMLFTGVDIDESGKSRKWRVENSWGTKYGQSGFYAMSDGWFDQHMFEVAVPRSLLSPEQIAALDTPIIELPPWDPMGALARCSSCEDGNCC